MASRTVRFHGSVLSMSSRLAVMYENIRILDIAPKFSALDKCMRLEELLKDISWHDWPCSA